MIYTGQISLNPPLGGLPSIYVFRANSCFDPDFTGVGHQPRGFDQLMSMYQAGVVTYSSIECLFGRSNADTTQVVVGVAVRDSTTAGADLVEYTELPRTVTDYRLCSTNTGGGITRAWIGVDQSKYLGITSILSDPNVRFSDAGNPGRDLAFHIHVTDLQAVDSNPVFVWVTINYDVLLTEPRQPPIS